jgi:hypothetical protein
LIENIAADAVYGIGGVTDHRPVTEHIRDPADQARLWIVRVDQKQHISSSVKLIKWFSSQQNMIQFGFAYSHENSSKQAVPCLKYLAQYGL